MKRFILTLMALSLGLCHINAQTVMSQEVSFDTVKVENVIVRKMTNEGTSIVYYKKQSSEQHYLLLHKTGVNTPTYISNAFLWPTHLAGAKYRINDMEIMGDSCYFCGACIYRGATTGLVGRIDLSRISANIIDFVFCTIPEAKEFMRMDASQMSTTARLALVGQMQYINHSSGAAFVLWNGTDWVYNIYEPQSSNETFTDIAFTANGNRVVAVSRLDGEPYAFCLRTEFAPIVFQTPPLFPSFDKRNIVNTQNLHPQSSSSPHPTWHQSDVDIRIVADLTDYELVTVAYECYDSSRVCEPGQQVAMFWVDLNGYAAWNPIINIVDKQIVRGCFGRSYTFSDIRYSPTDYTIGLLHKCRNCAEYMSTAVQFPFRNGYGDIEALYISPNLYSSMDISNGGRIYLSGIHPSDGHMVHFLQYKPYLENSCHLSYPMSQSEELMEDADIQINDTDHNTTGSTVQGVRRTPGNNLVETKVKCETILY